MVVAGAAVLGRQCLSLVFLASTQVGAPGSMDANHLTLIIDRRERMHTLFLSLGMPHRQPGKQ